MTTPRYRTGSSYAATATAILLSLPPIGDMRPPTVASVVPAEFEALGDINKIVADAVA